MSVSQENGNGLNGKKENKFVKIGDEFNTYDPELFILPSHYRDSIESVLLPHGLIMNRIQRLAQTIKEDYGNEPVTLLCVLKGGFRFCQDLMTSISELNRSSANSLQMNIEFIKAKSYVNDQQGNIIISSHGSSLDLKGKNVLIVEDVVDTGRTMEKLIAKVAEENPKTLKVATLLLKRNNKATGYRPDYLGFEIPDSIWLIGYGGFDYNEYFRDLDHIVVLNEFGKKKYTR